MTFGYSYKTSDGVRHEARAEARAKEEVFASLRARGIKPIKVWPIRRWYDVSKRTAAIVVLSLALVSLLFLYRRAEKAPTSALYPPADARQVPQMPRRQIAGLPKDVSSCFTYRSEAFLAQFVCPGQPVAPLSEPVLSAASADLADAIANPIAPQDADPPEVAEMKRIVTGIKEEARMILATGRTAEEALRYFYDRQCMEVEHRKRLLVQVQRGELSPDAANATFRTMGFATIPREK